MTGLEVKRPERIVVENIAASAAGRLRAVPKEEIRLVVENMETVHVDYLIERNAVHQTSELPVFHAAEAVAPLIRIVGVAGVIFQHIEPAVIDLERVDLALCGVDLLELVGGGVVAEQLFPT